MKKTKSRINYSVSYKTRIQGRNATVKYVVSFDYESDKCLKDEKIVSKGS